MKHEVENLINLAYSFFPKGVSDNADSYWHSEELKKLQKEISAKPLFISKINKLLIKIKKNYPQVIIEDINSIFPYDRCIKGKIYFKNQTLNTYLVFYVSVIVPFYAIYECFYNTFLSEKDIIEKKFILDHISTEYLQLYKVLNSAIKNGFAGYSVMNKNVLLTEVPNIVFNGNGILDSFSSKIAKPMTLFNVFFSDNYF